MVIFHSYVSLPEGIYIYIHTIIYYTYYWDLVCGMMMDNLYNHGLDAGLNHGLQSHHGDVGIFMGICAPKNQLFDDDV